MSNLVLIINCITYVSGKKITTIYIYCCKYKHQLAMANSASDRRPDYFPALARLVEVMRRTGTLDEAGPYLDRAEQAVLRANMDPGYNFCRGLYDW